MRIWVLVLLSGCSLYFGEDHPGSTGQPRTCAERVSFAPVTSDARDEELTVDQNGVNVCLHLDTTQIELADLEVSSSAVNGTSSKLEATLLDSAFQPITEGDDVIDTSGKPSATMQLHWVAPPLTKTDVILWVRAQDRPAAADLQIELFDPDF